MTPPVIDYKRTKLIYDYAADRYLASLPPEHFMEATPQATQREITLASFALVRVHRPDVQCFNELLVQYPASADDPDTPTQVVPDNMIVVHREPIVADTNFNTLLQPVGPFLVLEYVSKHSKRKDYEISYAKYEQALKIPYYLIFYPEADELSLFHLRDGRYRSVVPNAAGRLAIPELELAVALLGGWVRFWFRGELLPLPGDLLIERDAAREQLGEAAKQRDEAAKQRDEAARQRDEARRQLEAEQTARLAVEAELAKLRDELAKAKGTGG